MFLAARDLIDISGWDVSNGTDFSYMFYISDVFNGEIGLRMLVMELIFLGCLQFLHLIKILAWDVSKGTNFMEMFYTSSFNQDISVWDVSNGTEFLWMFHSAGEFIKILVVGM